MDQVPVVVAGFGQRPVAQDPGIVDQNVKAAVIINGRLHYLISIFNRVVVGDSLPT